ncbi:hypothetical protein QV65_20370, partial [Rhodococcus erythropolis]
MNTRPKYLASTTVTDPQWKNTTALSGDTAAAIGELKARPGGELQVHGSGELCRWLLANDLVDEMILLIVPVVLGQGTRLFPDTGPDIALELAESRATPKGVTIQRYLPLAGRSMQLPPPTASTDQGKAPVVVSRASAPNRVNVPFPSLERVSVSFTRSRTGGESAVLPAPNGVNGTFGR